MLSAKQRGGRSAPVAATTSPTATSPTRTVSSAATATSRAGALGHPRQLLEDAPSAGVRRERAIDWSWHCEDANAELVESTDGAWSCVAREDNVEPIEQRAQRFGGVEVEACLGRDGATFDKATFTRFMELVYCKAPCLAEMGIDVRSIARSNRYEPAESLREGTQGVSCASITHASPERSPPPPEGAWRRLNCIPTSCRTATEPVTDHGSRE